LYTTGSVNGTPLVTLTGTISSHSYILITNINASLAQADFTYGILNDSGKLGKSGGHVEIVDASGLPIDRVGWGSATQPFGHAAPLPDPGKSLQRITSSGGFFVNSLDNLNDFMIDPTITPQGGGFTAAPLPTTDTPTSTAGEEAQSSSNCTGVAISEVLPNPAGNDSGQEFIELHNPTTSAISLDGCGLQLDTKIYKLDGTVLMPGEYQTFNDTTTGLTLPNSSGAAIILFDSSTDLQIVTYPANLEDDVSWALADGSWSTTYTPTPGQPNSIATTKPCTEGQVRNAETNRCVAAGNASAIAGLAACPAGQERNPETNRCRSVATAAAASTLTPCKEGQERNPETNRCRAAASAASSLQPCPEGQERNPETNRCRKIAAAGTTGGSRLNGVQDVASDSKSPAKPYKLIILAALAAVFAYGVYEWRQEIRSLLIKSWGHIQARAQSRNTTNSPRLSPDVSILQLSQSTRRLSTSATLR
jgi:hypothetical protein